MTSIEPANAPTQSQGEHTEPKGHDNTQGKGTAIVTSTDTTTATAAQVMVISDTQRQFNAT